MSDCKRFDRQVYFLLERQQEAERLELLVSGTFGRRRWWLIGGVLGAMLATGMTLEEVVEECEVLLGEFRAWEWSRYGGDRPNEDEGSA